MRFDTAIEIEEPIAPPPQRSLEAHMLHGSMWTIGLRWAARITGLISTVILARLLTPADYGIVTIAMLIVGTVEMFSQTGQNAAVIRNPKATREHYDSAWTISLILGLSLGAIVLAATPLTTAYFHEPRAKPVVQILALRVALLGLQNVGTINFRRELKFHKQFFFTVWPELISFVVTVAGAFLLRNYWALVIGIMTKQVATVVLSYVMEPYRPRLCFDKVNEIWSFSIWMFFRNIGVQLNAQIDKIAIGGVVGTAFMGRYDVARDIAISPTQELINPMVIVLFPVMAKVQHDPEQRRKLYLTVLYWSALICVSTSIGVSLVAQDLVDLVLGPKWHDVIPLVPWFALAFGVLGLSNSVYSSFDTIGRPGVSARLQWVRLLVLGATVFPVAYLFRTLEAVAITRFVVTVAITPTLFYALGRALQVPMGDFVTTLWRPFTAGLFMAVAVLSVNAAIGFAGPWRLLLDVMVGVASFTAALMALWSINGRPEGPEHMLWKLISPVAGALRRYSAS